MFKVAILIWIMVGTTLAGIGLIVVVSIPSLDAQGMRFIPIGVAAGFLIAMPISLWIASKIMRLPKSKS